MGLRTFEDLDVWKRACRLAITVYEDLRESRDFALRDQMRRAVVSISCNIAEGCERDSRQDFVRFLRIAKGSAAELRTQCHLAAKLDIMSVASAAKRVEECKAISAMLQALIKSLLETANGKQKTEHAS